ncbi:MAG: hypothetical protein DRG87_05230 [Deltaproteobacteria bacterium]|nr:DUF1573 domain-containing protein [Deltaproteobacteria bacterium]MBW2078330.1 DUF1573 domain-containing protein [Deltaproteobacteria bacterium]MBW2311706.1 DUF1573 domain-containing protein [Deltaproteobacteria bacterium]RLB30395.1 MAG: hypothetical protein DRG87_05230 [Deltaproteobacteria bacterium]
MKRTLYGAFLLITCLFLCLPEGLAQEAAGPRIEIEERVFTAKKVKQGELIEHTFTVKNKGKEVLEIRKVSPG